MEKEKNQTGRAILALVLIFAVAAAAIFGLNIVTAPIIEVNGSAAALAPLYEVMPEAKAFELLYSAEDSAASALTGVPETVMSIYGETGGMGYALRLSTSEGYTKEPIELSFAVDTEGRIIGIQVDAYPESKDFGQDSYPLSFIGKDSALADVGLVAGVTYSSSAFKNAVSDGFTALIDNGLVGAGIKGDEQILTELISTVYPGMANSAGVVQYEEQEIAEGQYKFISRSFKAINGGGYAFIVKDGESSYLALCNVSGFCAVYGTDGQEISGDADSALLDEVKSASAGAASFAENDMKKLAKLLSESAEITELPLGGIFSSVTDAFSVTDGGTQYYAFAARPYGYSNLPMAFYFVLDANGAIAAMSCDELILIPEYFTDYELDEPSYKAGFEGQSADTWDSATALISGATFSSEAAETATTDVFAAFAAMTEKGREAA